MNHRKAEQEIHATLAQLGWEESERVRNFSFRDQKQLWRPDIVLIHRLNPLGAIEIIPPIQGSINDKVEQQEWKHKALSLRTQGVPFFLLSDGTSHLEFESQNDEFIARGELPTAIELWERLHQGETSPPQDPRLQPGLPLQEGYTLRFYQIQAISRTLEALLSGAKKFVVAMAPGSGVTSVQVQLAWKLLKSGFSRRLLILSDRDRHFILPSAFPADSVGTYSDILSGFSELGDLATIEGPNKVFRATLPQTSDSRAWERFVFQVQEVPSETFDLIFLDSSIPPPPDVADVLTSHFPTANIISFSGSLTHNSLTSVTSDSTGSFTYSFDQAIQEQWIQPVAPEGYQAIELRDLGEFRTGIFVKGDTYKPHTITSPKSETDSHIQIGDTDESAFVVSARDLRSGRVDLKKVRHISQKKLIEETTIRTKDDGGLDAAYLLKANDLVFVGVGRVGEVAVIPEQFPTQTVFSSSLIRFRPHESVLGPVIHSFLRSDTGQANLRRLEEGTAQPRLTISALKGLTVFLPLRQSQKEQAQVNGEQAIENCDDQPDSVSQPLSILDAHQNETNESLESVNLDSIIASTDIEDGLQNPVLSASATAVRRISDNILPLLSGTCNEEDGVNLRQAAELLRQVANDLCPPDLGERVRSSYPAPIALAYQRFDDARFNTFERVLRLKDLAEATCFFVYNVFLADVCHRLDPVRYFISDSGARRAYNGFSMSARLDLVNTIIQSALANEGGDLFVPEFASVPDIVTIGKRLQDEFRNRISHTASASESQQLRILEEFNPQVLLLLERLEFLSDYKLARVPSFYYEDGELKRQMIIYNGTVPFLDETPIAPDSLTPMERDHLILLNEEDQVLDLYPIYQLHSSESTRWETHLCFLKQRKAKDRFLDGESVTGAFPVSLSGFDRFEILQGRIIDKIPLTL